MSELYGNILNYKLEEIDISSTPLAEKSKDLRAKHCNTVAELELFKFSSNYQTYSGGSSDLAAEAGVDVSDNSNFTSE